MIVAMLFLDLLLANDVDWAASKWQGMTVRQQQRRQRCKHTPAADTCSMGSHEARRACPRCDHPRTRMHPAARSLTQLCILLPSCHGTPHPCSPPKPLLDLACSASCTCTGACGLHFNCDCQLPCAYP